MQTFLPYPNCIESAECLDYRRLGKQRVEAYQILNTLMFGSRWKNHPAVKMWKGYEDFLKLYINAMIRQWVYRGYKNTMKLYDFDDAFYKRVIMPPWYGDEKFHASHRSNLLRKDPVWYGKFGWTEPDNLPYVWPG